MGTAVPLSRVLTNREYGYLRVSWAVAPSVATTDRTDVTLSPLLYRAWKWYAVSPMKARANPPLLADVVKCQSWE